MSARQGHVVSGWGASQPQSRRAWLHPAVMDGCFGKRPGATGLYIFKTNKGGRDCTAIGVPKAQEAAISTFAIRRYQPFVDPGNCSLL